MEKISNYIFNISPKKLALYLVLGPLILLLVHTTSTILIRSISETSTPNETVINIVLGVLFLFLAAIVILYLFWLRSTVFSVEKSDLGLPLRWFNLACVVFLVYLVYNLCFSFIANVNEDYQHIFYALNEFIAFGGLLIAYPLLCHYAARAVVIKQTNEPATFIRAMPFTVLLIFGVVLGIPFLHKYFSKKTSSNTEIIIIYAIALGLCIVLFIIGFIAAISGLI